MNALLICTLVLEYIYSESLLPLGSVCIHREDGTSDLEGAVQRLILR